MLADFVGRTDFHFYQFEDGRIDKISKDESFLALGRSCLLYPEHLVIRLIS